MKCECGTQRGTDGRKCDDGGKQQQKRKVAVPGIQTGMPGSRCMAVRPGAFVGRGGFVEHLTTPFVMTTLVFAGGGFCKECGGGSGTWQRPFPAPLRWRGARAPCSTWQSQTALGRSWEDVRRTLARTESRNRGDGAPCAPSMFVRPTPQRTCARSRGTHGCLRAGQAGSRQGVRVGGGARCRRGELLCRLPGPSLAQSALAQPALCHSVTHLA